MTYAFPTHNIKVVLWRCALLVVLVLSMTDAVAQPTHWGVTLNAGRIVPVNGSRYEGFTPTAGVSGQLYWRQQSEKYWQHYWHNPSFGLHVGYAHLFDDMVGDRIELAGLLRTEVAKHLAFRANVGLSFYTNPFVRSRNFHNIFIGSYVNALITAGLQYEYPMRDGSTLTAGAGVVHSSNGYLAKPNRGLNYLQLELAARFATQQGQMQMVRDTALRQHKEVFEITANPFFSIAPAIVQSRNDSITHSKYYPAYALRAGFVTHAHPCFNFGASVDVMYNYAHYKYSHHNQSKVYVGMAGFGELLWGPVALHLGAGHYVDYYWQNWEPWYMRVGVFFDVARNQRLGAAMKLHYDHIDFIEWTYIVEIPIAQR